MVNAAQRLEWRELWQGQLASEMEAACGACPDLNAAETQERRLQWLTWRQQRIVARRSQLPAAPELAIALAVLEEMHQRIGGMP